MYRYVSLSSLTSWPFCHLKKSPSISCGPTNVTARSSTKSLRPRKKRSKTTKTTQTNEKKSRSAEKRGPGCLLRYLGDEILPIYIHIYIYIYLGIITNHDPDLDAPWDWSICLHGWLKFMVNVDEYTQTIPYMEHTGMKKGPSYIGIIVKHYKDPY